MGSVDLALGSLGYQGSGSLLREQAKHPCSILPTSPAYSVLSRPTGDPTSIPMELGRRIRLGSPRL